MQSTRRDLASSAKHTLQPIRSRPVSVFAAYLYLAPPTQLGGWQLRPRSRVQVLGVCGRRRGWRRRSPCISARASRPGRPGPRSFRILRGNWRGGAASELRPARGRSRMRAGPAVGPRPRRHRVRGCPRPPLSFPIHWMPLFLSPECDAVAKLDKCRPPRIETHSIRRRDPH
jgi:hypothetical protein